MAPSLSITITSSKPALDKILKMPYPADPAPAITTLTFFEFFRTIRNAFIKAANVMTAVPCLSS